MLCAVVYCEYWYMGTSEYQCVCKMFISLYDFYVIHTV